MEWVSRHLWLHPKAFLCNGCSFVDYGRHEALNTDETGAKYDHLGQSSFGQSLCRIATLGSPKPLCPLRLALQSFSVYTQDSGGKSEWLCLMRYSVGASGTSVRQGSFEAAAHRFTLIYAWLVRARLGGAQRSRTGQKRYTHTSTVGVCIFMYTLVCIHTQNLKRLPIKCDRCSEKAELNG